MTNRRTSPNRSGFTLVEMMVVIGIITLLAGILLVALGTVGTKAREQATRATIQKISKQVEERFDAFDRLRSQPQWTKDAKAKVAFYASQNPSQTVTLDQAKVMLFKDRIKISFPQSFNEFATVDPVEFLRMIDPQNALGITIPSSGYVDYSPWISAHPTHNTETESSAILYYILTNGKTLGIPTVDPGEFRASEAQDLDGDGLTEFVDAWQRPLRFYRWPTRLFCPTGSLDSLGRPVIDRTSSASWKTQFLGLPAAATPDPLAKDQDDPALALYDPNPNSTISNTFTEANYHTPQTYHQFLLVSSGPDGQKTAVANQAFGLYPPTDQYSAPGTLNSSTNYGYLAQPILTSAGYNALTDNITNRNR